MFLIRWQVQRDSAFDTLSGQGDTRPKYRLLAAGGVNVNRRTSGTPHSVALPAAKRRYPGSEGVLRLRFLILQGAGTKRTGRTLSDSNVAESKIRGAKPYVPLSTEGIPPRKQNISLKSLPGQFNTHQPAQTALYS